jgi:hypothetical protein
LLFEDTFAGALDTSRWDSSMYALAGTSASYDPTNPATSGGLLRLGATRVGPGSYHSSGVSTRYSYRIQGGRVEVRAKLPAGNIQGLWPSILLMPSSGDWPPEIDILEVLGHEPAKAYMNVHWADGGDQSDQTAYTLPAGTFADDFHVFALEWTDDSLIYYIDGVERKRRSLAGLGVNVPMYLAIGVAVNGTWPTLVGKTVIDGTTVFPSYFDIDYVRVWGRQRSNSFNLDLETGLPTGDSHAFTDDYGNGHITVSALAALNGTLRGMACSLGTDTTDRNVSRPLGPPPSGTLSLRFYFDPNGIAYPTGEQFALLGVQTAGSPWAVAEADYRRSGANHQLLVYGIHDNGTWAEGLPFVITDAPHLVEIHIERATTGAASDGRVRIWVDGTLKDTVAGIDNYDAWKSISQIQVGASGLDAGASGSFYLDELRITENDDMIGA